MGRGRTTTGMITACLIASTRNWKAETNGLGMEQEDDMTVDFYDSMDGPSEEEVYLSGENFPEFSVAGKTTHHFSPIC